MAFAEIKNDPPKRKKGGFGLLLLGMVWGVGVGISTIFLGQNYELLFMEGMETPMWAMGVFAFMAISALIVILLALTAVLAIMRKRPVGKSRWLLIVGALFGFGASQPILNWLMDQGGAI